MSPRPRPLAQIEQSLKSDDSLYSMASSVLFFLSDTRDDALVREWWNLLFSTVFHLSVGELETQWKQYYGESWPTKSEDGIRSAKAKLRGWKTVQGSSNAVSENATLAPVIR